MHIIIKQNILVCMYMIGQMHTRETQHTIFEFLLVCFSNINNIYIYIYLYYSNLLTMCMVGYIIYIAK
jgi:hypothetical protein